MIVLPTEALLEQTYSYLTEYSEFLESQYKWKIKIGRILKTHAEPGHIMVGLANKTSAYFSTNTSFLNELKWVVFDECDEVKTS